ncbi:peptidoglycan-binding protein [Microvirga sp. 2TAF3]|uniref:peptidoglycan-binding protein n=1 Tax=Microvirga sp. 2TAF3 TaxID=3233014 RepID=UPI003F9D0CA6
MSRACSRPIMNLCAVLSILIPTGHAGIALAQPTPMSVSRPSADPALDAARAAFEALPEADRKAIQEGLIWSGDYSGVADGTFGRQTYDAIVSLQKNAKKSPTGVLSSVDRSALQASAQRAKDLAGFANVDDPRTGMRIGVPVKLLSKQSDNPSGGSRWQSADDKITLDTRLAPPEATLQSLYDRNVAIQTPGRVVTYKVLRPDFFVITGETPAGKFYTRYASGTAGIRAFSVGYDKSLAPQFDRIVVAIANSFVPFPATSAPAATAQANAPAPAASPASPAPQAAMGGGRALIGTGLAVGARQVLTTAPVDRCKDARVRDLTPQQIGGKGPFLLEFAQDLGAKPIALGNNPMTPGARVLIVAYADDGEGNRLTATAGLAEDRPTFTAPLQPGASGAPVLDMHHGLIGLVGPVSADGRKIAGIMPSARYAFVTTSELGKAFPGIGMKDTEPAAQVMSAADLVASMRQAVVPITCGP